MRPIFLIGFMGSGKTTLGRALSAATGLQFIDLDYYIERRFHANVRDIFASRGEEGFRDIERRMLLEVSEFQDVVISCGGGTPCFFDNMEVMNAAGTTVLLEADPQVLHTRLTRGRHIRPLIAAMTDDEIRSYIDRSLENRNPHYHKAMHRFPSDRLDDSDQISSSVAEFIRQFFPSDFKPVNSVRK